MSRRGLFSISAITTGLWKEESRSTASLFSRTWQQFPTSCYLCKVASGFAFSHCDHVIPPQMAKPSVYSEGLGLGPWETRPVLMALPPKGWTMHYQLDLWELCFLLGSPQTCSNPLDRVALHWLSQGQEHFFVNVVCVCVCVFPKAVVCRSLRTCTQTILAGDFFILQLLAILSWQGRTSHN